MSHDEQDEWGSGWADEDTTEEHHQQPDATTSAIPDAAGLDAFEALRERYEEEKEKLAGAMQQVTYLEDEVTTYQQQMRQLEETLLEKDETLRTLQEQGGHGTGSGRVAELEEHLALSRAAELRVQVQLEALTEERNQLQVTLQTLQVAAEQAPPAEEEAGGAGWGGSEDDLLSEEVPQQGAAVAQPEQAADSGAAARVAELEEALREAERGLAEQAERAEAAALRLQEVEGERPRVGELWEKLQAQTAKCDALQEDGTSLRSRAAEAGEEVEALRAQIAEQADELEALRPVAEEAAGLQGRLAEVRAELAEAEAAAERGVEVQAAADGLAETVDACRQENEELKQRLQGLQESLEGAEGQRDALQEAVESLSAGAEGAVASVEVDALRTQHAEEVQALQAELTLAKEQLQAQPSTADAPEAAEAAGGGWDDSMEPSMEEPQATAGESKDEVREQADEASPEPEPAVTEGAEELTAAREQVRVLQERVDVLEAERDAAAATVPEAVPEETAPHTDAGAASAEVEALRTQHAEEVQALQAELTLAKEQLQAQPSTADAPEAAEAAGGGWDDSMEPSMEEPQEQVEATPQPEDTTSEELTAAREQVRVLQERVEALEGERDTLADDAQKAASTADTSKEELATLSDTNTALEQEVAALRASLQTQQAPAPQPEPEKPDAEEVAGPAEDTQPEPEEAQQQSDEASPEPEPAVAEDAEELTAAREQVRVLQERVDALEAERDAAAAAVPEETAPHTDAGAASAEVEALRTQHAEEVQALQAELTLAKEQLQAQPSTADPPEAAEAAGGGWDDSMEPSMEEPQATAGEPKDEVREQADEKAESESQELPAAQEPSMEEPQEQVEATSQPEDTTTEELTAAREQVRVLQERVEALEAERDTLATTAAEEKAAADTTLQELQAALETEQAQAAKTAQDFGELQTSKAQLEESLHHASATHDSLTAAAEAAEAARQQAESEMHDLRTQASAEQDTSTAAAQELEELRQTHAALRQQHEDSAAALAAAQEEAQVSRDQLEQNTTSSEALQAASQQAQEQAQQATADAEARAAEAAQEADLLRARASDAEAQLAAVQAATEGQSDASQQVADLQEKVAASQERIAKMKEGWRLMKDQRVAAEEKAAGLEARLQEAEAGLAEAQAAEQQQRTLLGEMDHRLQAAEAGLAEAQAAEQQQRTLLGETDHRLQAAEAELQQARRLEADASMDHQDRLQQLEAALGDAQGRASALEDELVHATASAHKAEAHAAESEDLRLQVAELNAALGTQQASADKLKEAGKKMKVARDEAKKEAKAAASRTAELEGQVAALAEQSAQREAEAAAAAAQLQEMQQQHDEACARAAALEQERTASDTSLSDAAAAARQAQEGLEARLAEAEQRAASAEASAAGLSSDAERMQGEVAALEGRCAKLKEAGKLLKADGAKKLASAQEDKAAVEGRLAEAEAAQRAAQEQLEEHRSLSAAEAATAAAQLQEVQQQHDEACARAADLEQQQAQAADTEEVERLREEAAEALSQADHWRDVLAAKEEDVAAAKGQVSDLQEQLQRLQAELAAAQTAHAEAPEAAEAAAGGWDDSMEPSMEEPQEQAAEKAESESQELTAAREQVRVLQERVDALEAERDAAAAAVPEETAPHTDAGAASAEVEALRTQHAEEVQALQAELTLAKEQLQAQPSTADAPEAAEAAGGGWDDSMEEPQEQVEATPQPEDNASEELTAAREQVRVLQERVEALEGERDTLADDAQKAASTADASKQELATLSDTNTALEQEVAALRASLQTQQAPAPQPEPEKPDADGWGDDSMEDPEPPSASELEDTLRASRAEVASLQDALDKAKSAAEDQTTLVQKLKAHGRQFREQRDTALENLKTCQAEAEAAAATAQEEAALLRQELSEAQGDAWGNGTSAAVHDECERLRREVAEQQHAADDLRAEADRFRELLTDSETRLSAMEGAAAQESASPQASGWGEWGDDMDEPDPPVTTGSPGKDAEKEMLARTLAGLGTELEERDVALEQARSALGTMESQYHEAGRAREECLKELSACKERVAMLEAARSAAEQDAQAARQQAEGLERDADRQQGIAEQAEAARDARIASLEASLREADAQLAGADVVGELRSQIADLTTAAEHNEAALAEAQQQCSALQAELDQAEARHDAAGRDSHQDAEQLRADLHSSRDTVAAKEAALAAAVAEAAELRVKVEALSDSLSSQEQVCRDLRGKCESLEAHQAQVGMAQGGQDVDDAWGGDLDMDDDDTEDDGDAQLLGAPLPADATALHEHAEELLDKLKEYKKRNEVVTQRCDDLTNDLRAANKRADELDLVEGDISEARANLMAAEARVALLEKLLAERDASVQDLQSQLAAAPRHEPAVPDQVEHEAELTDLRRQIEELSDKLHAADESHVLAHVTPIRQNGHSEAADDGSESDSTTEPEIDVGNPLDLEMAEREISLLKSVFAQNNQQLEASFAEHEAEEIRRLEAMERDISERLSSDHSPRARKTEEWLNEASMTLEEDEDTDSELSFGSAAVHLERLDQEVDQLKADLAQRLETDRSLEAEAESLLQAQHDILAQLTGNDVTLTGLSQGVQSTPVNDTTTNDIDAVSPLVDGLREANLTLAGEAALLRERMESLEVRLQDEVDTRAREAAEKDDALRKAQEAAEALRAEEARLQAANSELVQKFSQLQRKLESQGSISEARSVDLEAQVLQLQNEGSRREARLREFHSLRDSFEELQNKYSHVQQDVQTVKKSAQASEQDLRVTVRQLRTEVAQALDAKTAVSANLTNVTEQLMRAKGDREKYRVAHAAAEATSQELSQKLQTAKGRLARLERQSTARADTPKHSTGEPQEVEARCEHLEENLQKARQECSAQSVRYMDQLKLLNTAHKDLQVKNSTLEAKLSELQSIRIQLETDVRLRDEEVRLTVEKLELQRKRCSDLASERDSARDEADAQTEGFEMLKRDLEGANARLAIMSSELQEKRLDLVRVSELEARHSTHDDAVEQQLHSIKQALQGKQADLQVQADEAHRLRLQLVEAEGKCSYQAADIERLTEQLRTRNKSLDELQAELDVMHGDTTTDELRREVASLRQQLAAAQEGSADQADSIERHLVVKKQQTARIADLERVNGESVATISHLRSLLEMEERARIDAKRVGDQVSARQVQSELTVARHELQQMRSELQAAQGLAEDMKESWSRSERALAASNKRVLEVEEERRVLQSQLQDHATGSASTEALLTEAQRALAFTQAGQSEASAAAHSLKTDLSRLLQEAQEEGAALRKKLATSEGKCSALAASNERLQHAASQSETEFATALDQRDAAAADARERLARLQDGHIKDAHTIAGLRAELEVKERARRDAEERLKLTGEEDRVAAATALATKRAETLQQRLELTAQEAEDLRTKHEGASADLKEAVESLWRCERQKAECEKVIHRMTTDHLANERRAKEASATAESVVAQNIKLQRELEVVDEQVKDAQRRNKRLTEEMQLRAKREPRPERGDSKALLNTIKRLEAELDVTRGQPHSSAPVADLQTQVDYFTEKLLLTADLESVRRKCLTLENRVSQLSVSLRDADDQISEADEKRRDSEDKVEALLKQLEVADSRLKLAQQHEAPRPAPVAVEPPHDALDLLRQGSDVGESAWAELMNTEVERLNDLCTAAVTAATSQLGLCDKLNELQQRLESKLFSVLHARGRPLQNTFHKRTLQELLEECKNVTTTIRAAQEAAKKAKERLNTDVTAYKRSFLNHARAIRGVQSPWSDPIGRVLVQQHRGRWCGATQQLAENLLRDSQDLDRLLQRLKMWDSTRLEDAGAVQMVRMGPVGHGNRQSSSLLLLQELQVTSPRHDAWPTLTGATHDMGADYTVTSLREENSALKYDVRRLEDHLRALEAEIPETHRSFAEEERPPVAIEDGTLFKVCAVHIHCLESRCRLLRQVRAALTQALVPIDLPAVSGPRVLFRRAIAVVRCTSSLRVMAAATRDKLSCIESSPLGALMALLEADEGEPTRPKVQVPGSLQDPTATQLLFQGLRELKDTVETSRARVVGALGPDRASPSPNAFAIEDTETDTDDDALMNGIDVSL